MQETPSLQTTETVEMPPPRRRRITVWSVLFNLFVALLVLAVAGVFFILPRPAIQKFIAGYAIEYLAKKTESRIEVESVYIDVFDRIWLRNVYIEDWDCDTLLAARSIKLDIDRLALLEKRIDIEGLSMDSATINIGRKEGELFNFAYLINQFSSNKPATNTPVKPTTTPDTTKKTFNVSFSFDYLDLKNTKISFNDADKTNVTAQFKQLNVGVRTLGIEDKRIELNKVVLKQPNIGIRITPSTKTKKTPTDYSKILHITVGSWFIGAKEVAITDGTFNLLNLPERPQKKGEINFNNLAISKLNLSTQQISLYNDTIVAQKTLLTATEKSGFVLNKLQADVLLCNTLLQLENLTLQTSNTNLSNYLAFKMRTLREFGDFVKRIKLDVQLQPNSYFVFRDINYFVHGLDKPAILKHNFDRPIYVSGHATDRIGKLKTENLNIKVSKTQLIADVRLIGLPDAQSTNIDAKITKLNTTTADIRLLLPPKQKLPEQIMRLGNIAVNGRFTGFPKDFVAYGNINTSLGKLKTDVQMNLTNKIPRYSGDITVDNLALGKLINNNKLGSVSLTANIKGQGFNINDLHTFVKGKINQFTFNNYNYTNIGVDGEVNKKVFSGKYTVADPNINLNFEGVVNLNDPNLPRYNFTANVLKIDLQKLNLLKEGTLKETFVIAGSADLDLSGKNIDNIEGTAKLRNVKLIQPNRTFDIAKLDLVASSSNNNRKLTVKSDIADAEFTGSFKFLQLRDAFQNYAHTYFPYHIDSRPATEQQIVNFDIVIKDPTSVTKLFVADLKKIKADTISGYFNTYTKEARLNLNIDTLVYKTTELKKLVVNANSTKDHILFDSHVQEIVLNGAESRTLLPRIDLLGRVENDSLHFDLSVAADTARNHARLVGTLYAPNRNLLKMKFDSTLLVINRDRWQATTGLFTYNATDKTFEIDNVLLSKQEIVTENKTETLVKRLVQLSSKNDITSLVIENMPLSDFNYVPSIKNLGISTTVSGNVEIVGLLKEQKITANLNAQKLNFRGQGIGDLLIELNKEKNNPTINITKATVNNKGNYVLDANGTVTLPDKNHKIPQINVTANIVEGKLTFLEAFLKGLISKTEGKILNSKLIIAGDISKPSFNGSIDIANGKTTVNYLQTEYFIDNETIFFKDHDIVFKNTILTDKSAIDARKDNKKANEALLNGAVHLNDFKKMSIDLNMTTNNFPFLKTTAKDNTSFYGTAYGSGKINFGGPFSQLRVEVNAKSNKGTTIYLPLTGDTQFTENKIYTFISRSDTIKKPETIDFSGLTLDFNLDVTPDAEIQIIFDEQAGDIMRARGSGNMQMDISTFGDFKFDMFGTYTIKQGSYLFTLKNVINKYFSVVDGGTITFSGSPYDALLDLRAKYTVNNAVRSNIFTDNEKTSMPDATLTELKRAKKTDVFLVLSNSLSSPHIEFDIKDSNPGNSAADNLFAGKIDEIIRTNPNELNRQVFGLLVMNNFMPSDQFLNVNSGLTTTVSELLSNYLSSYLNEAISGLIPNSELNFNFSQYDEQGTGGIADESSSSRTKLSLDFKKDLNDRLSMEIGGSVDVDNQSGSNSEGILFANDIVLTYKLGKDGKYKLKMYNKFDNDVLLGNYSKQGVGFFVTQEFDSFEDLFAKSRKAREERRKAEKKQPTTPNQAPPINNTPTPPADKPKDNELPNQNLPQK